MTLTAQKNYAALDVGKFLCALLILFYHFFSEVGSLPPILEEALSLYAVAVALFMVISGFLTFNKLRAITGAEERWSCVRKQVVKIFKIYLLWSVPYIAYSISQWDFSSLTVEGVLWTVQGWVFNSTFYTIWFMPSLAIGLLLAFWITEKLPKKLAFALVVVAFVLGALLNTYRFVGDMLPGFSYVRDFIVTWLGGTRGWLTFGFPFVMLGKYMVSAVEKMKASRCFLFSVVCLAGLLAEALLLRKIAGHTGIDTCIMMIPTVIFLLGFLLTFELPDGRYSFYMRKMSILIFMSQRLFLSVLPGLLPESARDALLSNQLLAIIVMCGGTLVLSAGILLLSKRLKCFKNLY